MRKILQMSLILSLVVAICSCGRINEDKFIYVGHGAETPHYQLYYDVNKKMFLLIDKRNGCFQRDDTGTCLAFTLDQAKAFRENVLAKMIKIDMTLKKDADPDTVKNYNKAGVTAVTRGIKIDPTFATPIRQVNIDRQLQYILVDDQFDISAKLDAMLATDKAGKQNIRVAYTVDFPGVDKKFKTKLRPYVIDPSFLYSHMTIQSVHEAEARQKEVMKNHIDLSKQADKFLSDIFSKAQNKT